MKRGATDLIVLCTSGTAPGQDIGLKELDKRDRIRGYFRCVYHYVIKRDGEIEHGHRHHSEPAMSLGRYNALAVCICLVGGLGDPPVTRPQLASLKDLAAELQDEYPDARVVEHNEIDPRVPALGFNPLTCAEDLR